MRDPGLASNLYGTVVVWSVLHCNGKRAKSVTAPSLLKAQLFSLCALYGEWTSAGVSTYCHTLCGGAIAGQLLAGISLLRMQTATLHMCRLLAAPMIM